MMTGSAETVAGFPAGWLCISTTGRRSALPSCSASRMMRWTQNDEPALIQCVLQTVRQAFGRAYY